MPTTYTGEVVKWNDAKGLGFLSSKDFDKDVYVHHTAFGGGSLTVGGVVTFEVGEDDDGRRRADNVSGEAVVRGRPARSRSRSRERGSSGKVYVVKMRHLSRDIDEDDILDFFDDHDVSVSSRRLLIDRDTAFIQLRNQEDFDHATKKLDGKRLGRFRDRANIFRSGDRDFTEARYNIRRRQERRNRRRSPSSSSYSSHSRSRSPKRIKAKKSGERRERDTERTPKKEARKEREGERGEEKKEKRGRSPRRSRSPSSASRGSRGSSGTR